MNPLNISNIELYYASPDSTGKNIIRITGDELSHIIRVMRHKTGDKLFVTDGKGRIYETIIMRISSDVIEAKINEEYTFENANNNIYFCVPKLKSADRFETALEKCTELGITNFIVFNSDRSIRKGNKSERWEKIIRGAMKQSLRSYLPSVTIIDSPDEITAREGQIILLSQESDRVFTREVIKEKANYYLVFGPEGDFSEREKKMFDRQHIYNLGHYRLRSETAIIKCASILS